MLSLLLQWLRACDELSRERLSGHFKGAVPQLGHVVDWCSHLIDSHFASLIVASDRFACLLVVRLPCHTVAAMHCWLR